MTTLSKCFPDFATRADQLVEAARKHGVELRSVGGIAVWDRLPDDLLDKYEGLRDDPKDIDMVAPSGSEATAITAAFTDQGYTPDERLIAWRGDQRHQYFELDESGEPVMDIDVFLGPPPACHSFDLPSAAFTFEGTALPVTELLLQKLQIVQASHKDLFDMAFLLLAADSGRPGNELDRDRLTGLLSKDWGFFHTVGLNLEKVRDLADELEAEDSERVKMAVGDLANQIEAVPKSRKWKLRARVGTKVSWYEEVEELDR